MDYALINEGIVENIIYLHPENAHTFENAVSIENYPVQIGDTYENGFFYRDGEKFLTYNEIQEREILDMHEALMILGVTL